MVTKKSRNLQADAAAKSLKSCPTLRPHRRQPTRLPGPWDSPGKNTGVGCHFLLQCMQVKSQSEVAQCVRLLATPWTAAHQAPPSMGFSRQEYWSGVPLPSPSKLIGRHKSRGDSGSRGCQRKIGKVESLAPECKLWLIMSSLELKTTLI